VFRIAVHGRDLVTVSIMVSCDKRVDFFEYMACSFREGADDREKARLFIDNNDFVMAWEVFEGQRKESGRLWWLVLMWRLGAGVDLYFPAAQ
jgi:hypothetical protein